MLRRILSAIAGRPSPKTYYVDPSRSVGMAVIKDGPHKHLAVAFVDEDTQRSITVRIPPEWWPTIAQRASQYAALHELEQRRDRESAARMAMAEYPYPTADQDA